MFPLVFPVLTGHHAKHSIENTINDIVKIKFLIREKKLTLNKIPKKRGSHDSPASV